MLLLLLLLLLLLTTTILMLRPLATKQPIANTAAIVQHRGRSCSGSKWAM